MNIVNPIDIPDDGWHIWIDRQATWRDDLIWLPSQVDLGRLPINAPTGGWGALQQPDATVSLPATAEQHFWGHFGLRPYTGDEYRYAQDDDVPQNGAWRGVSWWYRDIEIPSSARGQRVLLHIRGARLRAEVFLNEQLVGYSIMSELPIDCDVTAAMVPGALNRLAIRITNPGGRYDWRDSTTMMWGQLKLFASHGFGGLDRGLSLTVHPLEAHIREAWVLNTADPHRVTAHMEVVLTGARRHVPTAVLFASAMKVQPADIGLDVVDVRDGVAQVRFTVSAPLAELWDLDSRNLYHLRLDWGADSRVVRFGFRSFVVDGLGSNAVLRLNGRRIKLYSAISWGYWGYNGLWPTQTLARREVDAAKALGLNTLHAHRNVGKTDVFAAQDEGGLLRVMEPGGGRHAVARDLKPGESLSEADVFSRAYMVEKCVAMARTFRSHPSLVQYTLQNEISAKLNNPDVQAVLKAIHDTDPSRPVVLNDGFVARGVAQAMYLPYDDHYYRSDHETWGGWWVNHQGAGDQWYDKFYRSKDDYIHRQTGREFIVEFGEMQGCAVADNHVKIVADIMAHGGKSYDLADHRAIVETTSDFLDRWGFRSAFPTTESLFLSIGRKAYDAWQHYGENIRIGDTVDIAAISGWETTAIENHSGIVDNLRYFKANPDLVKSSLRPVRPVAKTRKLAFELGEVVELDIWLLNDTDTQLTGTLALSVIAPDGQATAIATWPVPTHVRDQYSYLLAEKVVTPALTQPGLHKIQLELPGHWTSTFVREIWVTDTRPTFPRPLRIGLSGIARSFRDQLLQIGGVSFEDMRPGGHYDGIIASGLKADEIERRQIAEQTGLEAQPQKGEKPAVTPGELPQDVLDAVRRGIPLLAMVPEDGLADGVARQLAGLGLFTYSGQVGNLRAPWMGNWNYVRAHPLFAGIPADQALSVLHQVPGEASNGLIVEGEGIQVVGAYSRDHDRRNGAACFTVVKNGMRILFHRMPDMAAPLQRRFLSNAMMWMSTRP